MREMFSMVGSLRLKERTVRRRPPARGRGLAEGGAGVFRLQARAAAAEELLPQGAGSVGGLVAAACLQLGHHQVDEVGVALRLHGAGQVEAVQAGIGDPAFEVVGDLARVAYQGHVAAAQGQLVEELAHGGVGARHGEVLHHRLDGVVLLVADRLVESVARQVDAAGAGEVRQAGLGAGVAAVLGMLVAGLGRGGGDDHVDAHEDPDVLGATAGTDHRRADALHQLAGGLAGLSGDEHAFGVARGEGQATLRGAGLEQHRGALWRGLGEVVALDLVELAMVADLVDLLRPRVEPALAVGEHRVVFPAAFPELVEDLQVLVGAVVAAVVLDLPRTGPWRGPRFPGSR